MMDEMQYDLLCLSPFTAAVRFQNTSMQHNIVFHPVSLIFLKGGYKIDILV